MTEDRWDRLVTGISGDDIEMMVKACEQLYKESEASDVPRLLELLKHENFVVREAAAWPLVSLGGAKVLPELFIALQRGYNEGLDNDGFQTALIELVEQDRDESREKLSELKNSSERAFREYADWLLEFC